MSADSVVPNPNDTYSYDRYAYCRNNPVNLTDPTGHAFGLDDLALAILIGALVGGAMAAINGANIFEGMALGAVSGALFGGAEYLGLGIGGAMAAGAVSGAINAAVYGGNIFQSALIGAGAAAIGHGIGAAGGSKGGVYAAGHTWEKAAVSVLSGGVVGGLSSVAMGGDFWKGFTQGAASAGLSFAANSIANNIEEEGQYNKAANKASEDYSRGGSSRFVSRYGYGTYAAANSLTASADWPDGYYLFSVFPSSGEPASEWGHTAFIVVKDDQIAFSLNEGGSGLFSPHVMNFITSYISENRPVLVTKLPPPDNPEEMMRVGLLMKSKNLSGGFCAWTVGNTLFAGGYDVPLTTFWLPNSLRDWAVSTYPTRSALFVPGIESFHGPFAQTLNQYNNMGVMTFFLGD
jgi:hypothetical protein